MNNQFKKMLLNNEKELFKVFPNYQQSINQLIKKVEVVKYDGVLYELILRSFGSNEKQIQEKEYNLKGYKSARQFVIDNCSLLDLTDKPNLDNLFDGEMFLPVEICSLANNYNNQVGMYYLKNENAVIIKSTVEDNSRPYDDKWVKKNIILKYYMQSEKENALRTLVFSNTPNAKIFNALMEGSIINIYTFVNQRKGMPYEYCGVYHPCGLIDQNKSFLLYKDGHENEIPYDNLEAQFLMTLLRDNRYPDTTTTAIPFVEKINPGKRNNPILMKTSKRNLIQQKKINLEVELRGEDLVMAFERTKLIERGYIELAQRVENVSLFDDSLGYDIRSFEIDIYGTPVDLYIKVVSMVSDNFNSFKIRTNEYNLQIENSHAVLYRVYDIYTDKPKMNKIFADFDKIFETQTNEYIATLKC